MLTFKEKLKDYIGILFYRHGLFCASNPIPSLLFVFAVLILCCYPLRNLPLLGESLEQFTQNEEQFDGLDAKFQLNEDFNYVKLPDRPQWYSQIPVAYIQQILIKTKINNNEINSSQNNETNLNNILYKTIDNLFDLNELIQNININNENLNLNKICLHVNDIRVGATGGDTLNDGEAKRFNLPQYNCLYLSPTNYWNNNLYSFKQDYNLIKTINHDNNFNNYIFGINYLNDLYKNNFLTYSITIVFEKYARVYVNELKVKLSKLTEFRLVKSLNNDYIHLQYTNKNLFYYIPFIMLYLILFIYIYISVSKIEFVKSKWGLAFAAVAQVIASLFMSVGICTYFGLQSTLNKSEILPYLVIFIGFENIVVLTKSVVSTPINLDVRYRIALGLQKESWKITKNLTFELIIIFVGILTMVPAIQEFCAFAYVGLLIDFFLQMIYFVTVLSIDIRRMESSKCNQNVKLNLINYDDSHQRHQTKANRPQSSFINKIFIYKKSLQFFYFWARTRLIQRLIMCLSMVWFILIFYKSMLVVELLRYDVNISKQTLDALIPKSPSFFYQYLSTPLPAIVTSASTASTTYAPVLLDVHNDNTSDTFKSVFEPNWKRLDYYHWINLFSFYNISIYDRYITILPQINLYSELTLDQPPSVLDGINMKKANTKITTKNIINELKLLTSNIKTAILELALIIILGIPAIILLVYLIVFLYKCLCSKKYEQWRRTWSTSSIKKQYSKIHLQNKDGNSDENDSTDADLLTDTTSPYALSISENIEIIHDIHPIIRLDGYHRYPIDLIGFNTDKFVSIDVTNHIYLWNIDYNNYYIDNINFNETFKRDLMRNGGASVIGDDSLAIWCVLILNSELILLSLSNGCLCLINYVKKQMVQILSSTTTHISSCDPNSNPILSLKQIEKTQIDNDNEVYHLLMMRLNGYMETSKLFIRDNIHYVNYEISSQIRPHDSTVKYCAHNTDYIITTTNNDHILKIFNLNTLNLVNNFILSCDDVDNDTNLIKIDELNQIYTCTLNGTINVHNLHKFLFKLKTTKSTKQICNLTFNSKFIFVLNTQNYFYIWNKFNGTLLKYFNLSKQFADIFPLTSTLQHHTHKFFTNLFIYKTNTIVIVFNLTFYLFDLSKFKFKKIFNLCFNNKQLGDNDDGDKVTGTKQMVVFNNLKILNLFDGLDGDDSMRSKYFLVSNLTNNLCLYELSNIIDV